MARRVSGSRQPSPSSASWRSRSRCAMWNGLSPPATPSAWPSCRSRFRRTKVDRRQSREHPRYLPHAHGKGAWRRSHRKGPSPPSPISSTTTSTTCAMCTRRRARSCRRLCWVRCGPSRTKRARKKRSTTRCWSWMRGRLGVGWYNKHHLVPFLGILPGAVLRSQLAPAAAAAVLGFQSRRRGAQEPLDAAGQKISVGICYEDAYGSTQLGALAKATMLVNVTNDSWFGHSTARYQHLQISWLRARLVQPAHGAGRQRWCLGGHRRPR